MEKLREQAVGVNPDLKVEPARSQLQTQGWTQVNAFLSPQFARQLRETLLHEVPWTLAYRGPGGSVTLDHERYRALSPAALQDLTQEACEVARDDFGFIYESYMMIPAYLEQRDPELLLHRVTELLNHTHTLSLLRGLVDRDDIVRLDAQATCYRPGHFLRYHNDLAETDGRRVAFVLNLSDHWQADWGGLLQILDGRSQVVATLMPRFNALSLFRVPTDHCVSAVAPFVTEPRLAITGWLRT